LDESFKTSSGSKCRPIYHAEPEAGPKAKEQQRPAIKIKAKICLNIEKK